ncbi:transcriptional regulator, AsnC family [Catenulispora acidiphila DSM 44928]|uniref:Transcriptional regulator, AsnC family n=1 Tax=Catenulispora acidiphila (strain DSM 44928 / JCM 14897 / NBRC 102108 / NRRL B-24433 / ID139908) TaxID=479433 RepID=C7QI93_CATAD|nr:Lrp/AsnC family transcriptional regulator [Catenulispora acidiphila]ACU73138.1 transcriptional regulator, AsnC family [Catenulispora acidiphila DSM 44928]
MTELDAIDSALLALLQNDGRRTNRELATLLNIAPSTCLERMRALRRRGLIVGYHAQVDLAAIGRPLQALIAVRVRPPNRAVIDGFRAFVEELPEVLSVFVVSGGDDFLIHVAVKDTDQLQALVLDKLTRRKELADVRTSLVYEHLRKTEIAPL